MVLWLYLIGCNSTKQTVLILAEDTSVDTDNTDSDSATQETDTVDTAVEDTETEDSGAEETDDPIPTNLLLNPSFEDGPNNWNLWGGAEITADNPQDGVSSLVATAINGSEQLVELEPNSTYRLSGWGAVEDPNYRISIGVKYHGNPEDRVFFSETEYTEKSLEFSTGFGATSAIIYAYKHDGETRGYADNLSLTYVGPAYDQAVWSDEFDDTGSPDGSKWQFEEGFVRNQELQWYQSDNAFQENGHLIIEGRAETRPNPNYVEGSSDWKTNREFIEYTSSSIRTKDRFDWMYGRLVVRAKVTNLTGTWPAIWTLGVDCQWPSNGEVDVMENYGGNILANYAWGTNQQWSPQWDSSATPVSSFPTDWTDDFHIWELDWTSSKMSIYLDGQLLNSVSLNGTINGSANCEGQNPFQQPHFLLLNLALGSNGGSVESLSFPTRYIVDYVRIYQ